MKYLALCTLTLSMLLSLCGCRMSKPISTTVPTVTLPMEDQNSVTMGTNIPDPSVDTSMPDPSVDTSIPETNHSTESTR